MPSVVPLVPITLDRLRHLRLDRRAIFVSELELTRLWGHPCTFYSVMLDIMNAISSGAIGGLSLNTLAVLVWQGLLHESPELTLEATQDMLPFQHVVQIFEIASAVLTAWNVSTEVPPGTPTEGTDTIDPLRPSTGLPAGVSSAVNSASVTTSSGV